MAAQCVLVYHGSSQSADISELYPIWRHLIIYRVLCETQSWVIHETLESATNVLF